MSNPLGNQFILDPQWKRNVEPEEVLRSGKIIAYTKAKSLNKKDERASFARSFCTVVVEGLWESVSRQKKQSWVLPTSLAHSPIRKQDPNLYSLALAMGEASAALDLSVASYLIGTVYTTLLPDEDRSSFGAYYTPPPLVSRLLDMAGHAGVDWRTCKICDPACGGGAFLASVAARIVEENRHVPPKMVLRALSQRLRGWEIDPFAAWLSQVFLELSISDLCHKAGERLPRLVDVTNSLLREDSEEEFDLVIGNPPYGRVTLDPQVRERYRRSLFGHANLYGLFSDLAIRVTRPGGVIAYVTPTSFLAGEYFKSLRALLANEARPVNMDFVTARKGVFENVLQETLLATYKRGRKKSVASVHFISPEDDGSIALTEAGFFKLPSDASGPWLIPRSSSEGDLVRALGSFESRLTDYGYSVSTGPLVWNRHKNQLRTKPSSDVLPLIWAECVTTDGQFKFRALKKNHQPFFLPVDGDDWLISRDPCVLVQRTTAKEQNKRLIAAELPRRFIDKHGGVVIENHLNMIRPITNEPPVPFMVLTALLNSSIVDRAFRCISGSVAVSAYELEALPLPSVDRIVPLIDLVEARASRETVDEFCLGIFENR